MNLIDRFRRNVLNLIEKKELSQADLARTMEVNPQYVSKYLKHNKPGIDTIARFAAALGVDPSKLLEEPGQAKEEIAGKRNSKRQAARA